MRRLLPLLLLAGCASPEPAKPVAAADPRIYVHVLYVLEDGSVYRSDGLATALDRANKCEVRTDRDETFTRYSFTLHHESPCHVWTSL